MALTTARTKKETAEAPTGLRVCIESHAGPAGVVTEGARLSGNHPAVLHAPHLFVADGADDVEIGSAKAALSDRAISIGQELQAAELRERAKHKKLARCVKGFVLDLEQARQHDPRLPTWGVISIGEGTIFGVNDAPVKANPGAFEVFTPDA